MTTPDWYAEERFAEITAQAREGLQEMREAGEPEPVAFHASPEDEAGRAVLRALGLPDPAAGQPAPLLVLPKARVAALLDEHVSRGLGSRVMGAPVLPADAFRVVSLCPGRLAIHVIVFDGRRPLRVASFFLDLATRVLVLNTEGDRWDTLKLDW
jgi:hypothetical protein